MDWTAEQRAGQVVRDGSGRTADAGPTPKPRHEFHGGRRARRALRAAATAAVAAASAGILLPATTSAAGGGHWLAPVGGNWNNGSNWSSGAQPTVADDATF